MTAQTVAAGKRDAYTVSRGCLRQAGEGADAVGFRSRGIVLQVDPSPRLRLGTFNGRRPTRESLIGNGGSAPPVSRFLYRPHYRRIKSESQDHLADMGVTHFERNFSSALRSPSLAQ